MFKNGTKKKAKKKKIKFDKNIISIKIRGDDSHSEIFQRLKNFVGGKIK